MLATMLRQYGVMVGVADQTVDDPEMMALLREALIEDWREQIARQGLAPADEPIVETDANFAYGWPLRTPDGEPILGDDGEQLVDHIKLIMRVRGPVEQVITYPSQTT